MEPMTARELDKMQCEIPGCSHENDTPKITGSQCHPGQGIQAVYFPKTTTLEIWCIVCNELVIAIKVASD